MEFTKSGPGSSKATQEVIKSGWKSSRVENEVYFSVSVPASESILHFLGKIEPGDRPRGAMNEPRDLWEANGLYYPCINNNHRYEVIGHLSGANSNLKIFTGMLVYWVQSDTEKWSPKWL